MTRSLLLQRLQTLAEQQPPSQPPSRPPDLPAEAAQRAEAARRAGGPAAATAQRREAAAARRAGGEARDGGGRAKEQRGGVRLESVLAANPLVALPAPPVPALPPYAFPSPTLHPPQLGRGNATLAGTGMDTGTSTGMGTCTGTGTGTGTGMGTGTGTGTGIGTGRDLRERWEQALISGKGRAIWNNGQTTAMLGIMRDVLRAEGTPLPSRIEDWGAVHREWLWRGCPRYSEEQLRLRCKVVRGWVKDIQLLQSLLPPEVSWDSTTQRFSPDPKVRVLHVREGEVREGEVREGDVRVGEVREGEVREGEVREGEVREGEVREGEVRVGKVREGEVREAKVRVGEVRVGEVREGEVREGEVREGKEEEDEEDEEVWGEGEGEEDDGEEEDEVVEVRAGGGEDWEAEEEEVEEVERGGEEGWGNGERMWRVAGRYRHEVGETEEGWRQGGVMESGGGVESWMVMSGGERGADAPRANGVPRAEVARNNVTFADGARPADVAIVDMAHAADMAGASTDERDEYPARQAARIAGMVASRREQGGTERLGVEGEEGGAGDGGGGNGSARWRDGVLEGWNRGEERQEGGRGEEGRAGRGVKRSRPVWVQVRERKRQRRVMESVARALTTFRSMAEKGQPHVH
ncbi:unnamed protein product [Closterium sp. NIES-54]